MRLTIASLAGAAVLALYSITPAIAGAPAGSYQQTCTNITMNGETLSASCKTFSGSVKSTSLPFADSCVGVISNVDGNLACTGPTGSYARTCKSATVSGVTISASCQKVDGSWMNSSSGFSGFQHPVTNCNGQLVDRPNC